MALDHIVRKISVPPDLSAFLFHHDDPRLTGQGDPVLPAFHVVHIVGIIHKSVRSAQRRSKVQGRRIAVCPFLMRVIKLNERFVPPLHLLQAVLVSACGQDEVSVTAELQRVICIQMVEAKILIDRYPLF